MSLTTQRKIPRILALFLTGCATGLKDCATGSWAFLGSRQLRNLCAGMAVCCAIYLAQQAALIERSLEHVAYAQQISGYAVMRQLQSMGQSPEQLVHPTGNPERRSTPTAIDPAQLMLPAAGHALAAAPATSATPARTATPGTR